MNKTEILKQVANNLEHMAQIERVVELADIDPVIMELMQEYQELRVQNGELLRAYREEKQLEEFEQALNETMNPF